MGLDFGLARAWLRFILDRDARGILAQVISITLISALAFPLLSISQDSLIGAHAPISIFMLLGVFVFGIFMQIVQGADQMFW